MPKADPHPAERMLTVLDWWLADHFDHGRNPLIEHKIVELQAVIQNQIDIDQQKNDREPEARE